MRTVGKLCLFEKGAGVKCLPLHARTLCLRKLIFQSASFLDGTIILIFESLSIKIVRIRRNAAFVALVFSLEI